MFGVHYQEMLVVFLIVLLLFGGKKIPEIARGLGRGLREFKKARDEFDASLDAPDKDPEAAPKKRPEASSNSETDTGAGTSDEKEPQA